VIDNPQITKINLTTGPQAITGSTRLQATTSETFVQNANLFGKVYFPRLTVPVSILLSNLVALAIQFASISGLPDLLLAGWIEGTAQLVGLVYSGIAIDDGRAGAGVRYYRLLHDHPLSRFAFSRNLWSAALDVCNSGCLSDFTNSCKIPVDHCPQPHGADRRDVQICIPRRGTIIPWQVGLSIFNTLVILIIGIILFSRIEKALWILFETVKNER
jgi:hypothetical protein